MSITKKSTYANLQTNSTGKFETPKPVLSRYLKNSTGSCHDRCKHGKHTTEECTTTGKTCPVTKLIRSTSQRGHKVRISIFKRLYDRKFRVPTATTAAADTVTSPNDKKSPDKYLYILPSNGAKSVVGPIKQKGNSSPWLPSCSVKKKSRCPKKDTNTFAKSAKSVPSPMVEKSRRRAEIRAATIVPDSSLKPMDNAPTNINLRKGDDMAKLEEKSLIQFKRGKVVEPRVDCNIMWRLKFRKSRLLDDRQSGGDIGRRSYKKVEAGAAQKGAKSEKVVLRHCESENVGKDQSLLNNVIEQTASKLAESRKSKVKALVGAFETVISLQHPKSRVKAC